MTHDFKWRHFRREIILWAVRWCCRYGVSYRDLEEMLEERGVKVDRTTIYRWVQAYAPRDRKAPAVALPAAQLPTVLARG